MIPLGYATRPSICIIVDREATNRRGYTMAAQSAPAPVVPADPGQTVGSFRKGLKQFSDALCEDVAKSGSPVRLNWKLTKLAYDKQTNLHVLDYDTPEGPKRLRSKALIMTSPSYVTAPLLKEVCSPAAEALEGIFYPRVAAVTAGAPKEGATGRVLGCAGRWSIDITDGEP
eukprot:Skav225423  [mRNA]  locus=scaffold680:144998:151408:- [translate_table: standard]